MASFTPEPQTCGYLGPEGTYTEEAASRAASGAQLVPFVSIERVFEAVAKGEVARGVVPVENLIQGPVTEALDCLYQYANQVVLSGMILLPIRHALGALHADGAISRIYSKDQALKQCSQYLHERYPHATLHETTSTSAPMREIADGRLPDAAVVGSAKALVRHGLQVLAHDIGNAQGNKTKFVVIASSDGPASSRTGSDSTLCVVYPHRDRVGLLRTVVDVVSGQFGLNLSAIHSRPDARGAFRFFLEVEGHMNDPALVGCFDKLRAELGGEQVDVVVVGSYPRTTFIEQRITDVVLINAATDDAKWLVDLLQRCGPCLHVFDGEDFSALHTTMEKAQAVIVHGPIGEIGPVLTKLEAEMHAGQLLVVVTHDLEAAASMTIVGTGQGVELLVLRRLPGQDGRDARGCTLELAPVSGSGDLADEFEAALYKHGARLLRHDAATEATP